MFVTESSEKKNIRYVAMVVAQCDNKSPIYVCVIHVCITNSRSRRHILKAFRCVAHTHTTNFATHCNKLQQYRQLHASAAPKSSGAHCSTLQHTATHHTATHYPPRAPAAPKSSRTTLQHTAAHCNALQHTVNLARLQFPEAVAPGV